MLYARGMFLALAGGRGEKRLMLMAMRVLGGRGAACFVAQMESSGILLVGLAPLMTLWCVARVPNFLERSETGRAFPRPARRLGLGEGRG